MGFSSLDDFNNKYKVNGQSCRTHWTKQTLPTTNQSGGMWYDLYPGAGTPGTDGFTATSYGNGTNLAFQPLVAGSGTVGIPTAGNVSPATQHIVSSQIFSSTLLSDCIFILVDILGYYPITTVTTTGPQTLTNTNPFPQRYNISGAASGSSGMELKCYVVASPGSATTAMGNATPNISMTYTNSNGVSGRSNTGQTLQIGTAFAAKGEIVYTGTAAAGNYGPFMPLAAGDSGIASVQTINLSASYLSGVLNLVVCRPLITTFFLTTTDAIEKDFLNISPSLPRVYDGSVLSWLMYASSANPTSAPIYGHLDFGWG